MTNDRTDASVTDLLERATRGLAPDVPRLIERGTTRGRRTRRLRLAVTTVAAVAVLGGSAAIFPSLIASTSGAHRGQPTVASDPGTARRPLAVPQDQFARTLSALLPGNDPRTGLSGGDADLNYARSGSLTWHGARIFVGIDDTPDPLLDAPGATHSDGPSPSPRPAPATARDWCHAMAGDACRELSNGDWAASSEGFDGDRSNPAGWQTTFGLYTTDGYLILAQASSLDNGTAGRARQPVLSVPQLRAVAESAGWFTD